MPSREPLVSICLPVYNAADVLSEVVTSVLSQDYPNIELVIGDNASTDATEEMCRELARLDARVSYHRHVENMGEFLNFLSVMKLARGEYFRWIGDDDSIAPTLVSRSMELFAADPRLILVTAQTEFIEPSGRRQTATYSGTALSSDDPIERLGEMLHLLSESYLLMDPLYAVMRRDVVASVPRSEVIDEDEVFACRLALTGPWAHLSEVLATRNRREVRRTTLARRHGLPAWHARMSLALQTQGLMRMVDDVELTAEDRRRAKRAIGRMYVSRQRLVAGRRIKQIGALATGRWPAGTRHG